MNFKVEDLREKQNASADLKIVYPSGFAMLASLDMATSEAFICGFESVSSTIDLIIPIEVDGHIVRGIKDKAFYECICLTSITIPDSVTKIGDDAFAKCSALTSITIEDPSLLTGSGVSEEVEVQSRYNAKLMNLYEQNMDKPNNPELVKLAHSIAFSPVIFDFADKLDIRNAIDFNNVFLNSMLENQSTLQSVDFGFIKYLHVFNHAGSNNIGYINLYFDYAAEKLSNDKKEIDINNKVFSDDSLIFLNKNDIGIMGGGIVEYCNSTNNMILDPYFYPVVSLDKKRCCQPSEFLKEWFRLSKNDLNEATSFLVSLEDFIKEDGHITNVFYIGNYGEGLDRDYSLWANVGIDVTNVKNKECVKAFIEQLRQFLHRISVQIQFGIKRHELRETAVRSAVGQVSSRNFSHNFGSHVFSKLMSNDTYENIEKLASNDAYVSCYDKMSITPGEQLACFLQYVKNRMDYLSELTFGVSNILTAKKIYSDVFKELDRVRLLLNHISGVSGFKYKFCLKHNGVDLGEGRDISVAFPSDVLGIQALFNILENIIRNTAKHAMRNDVASGCETFTIEFSDNDDFSEYYCVEIDNGIKESNIDFLVKGQNERINSSILDGANNLRTHSLGLLEIEASAAFLRQIDIAKIDSYEYQFENDDAYRNKLGNLIILKAINKKGALGCRFFLQKPKEFLFVGDGWESNLQNRKNLLNYGVRVIKSDEFVKLLRKGKSFAHQFLIYNNAISTEAETLLSDDNDSKTLLPLKKLKFNHDQTLMVLNMFKDANKFELVHRLKEIAWNLYYQQVILEEQKNPLNDCISITGSVITPDEETVLPPNQVVFINHATANNHMDKWDSAQENQSFEAWVENFSSRSSAKLPEFDILSVGRHDPILNYLINLENMENVDWIKQALFSAYHEQVVVIDERIQGHTKKHEGSSDDNSGPIPVGSLYKSTNVIIPDPSTMPLDPRQYDMVTINNIESFIDDKCVNALLLIHYGVLERMYKSDSIIEQSAIIRGKLNEWSKKAKRVVVTSGRGSHSLPLPDSVCFVDLSSVLYAFVANRNKYIIDYLLHQARRKNG